MTRSIAILALALPALAMASLSPASAHGSASKLQQSIRFDQNIGARLPLGLHFRDSRGRDVRLGDLLDGKPMVLQMAWYSCANLCPITMRNLAKALREVPFKPGSDFNVVTVSIDPLESPRDGADARAEMLQAYGQGPHDPGAAGWHALTGTEAAIRELAARVGFHYAYDPDQHQYAHPAGVVLIDGSGRVSHYLFGLEFAGRDLKLGLVDASKGQLGSPIDQLVLRCHTFNPLTGQYTLAVMKVVDVAAGATVLVLGGFIAFWLVRERRQRRRA